MEHSFHMVQACSDGKARAGEINTPHIDSLAKDGMRFTQFYNCARCVPTRQSLLTGLYPQQVDGKHSVTFAEVLRGAGYRTLMAGKWHEYRGLGLPTAKKIIHETRLFAKKQGFC